MKVKDLIAKLATLDMERQIIISSDEEGNNVGHIDDVEPTVSLDDFGYIIYPKNSPDLNDDFQGYGLDE